jgi:hypothetical protein
MLPFVDIHDNTSFSHFVDNHFGKRSDDALSICIFELESVCPVSCWFPRNLKFSPMRYPFYLNNYSYIVLRR